ncbi:hypothetical protein [uncultured Mucilaginibacter sp.]|uniref:hypothetical protein n=1 Tax=uncultured Mucilaginibacter sp. TaxID=797541 RepID=UPI002600B4FD|nr:hypothetical protein [uncultured Mucilaginibacter sp.]
MSFKSLAKTRWRIEPERVIIYPTGVFYIFVPIMAILGIGLLYMYTSTQNVSISQSMPIVLLILLIVVLFWGAANTYIEFDNRQARMRKMFMGFIPTKNIPFAQLHGIDVVSGITTGSYNYSLFRKNSRYGKGIVVSSAYTKNDDPNAIAFVEEAVPIIHGYLEKYDSPADFVSEPITSYKYFELKGNVYAVKSNKIGALITGIVLIGIGLWLFTIPADSLIAILFCIGLLFLFGVVFINAAFTQFLFDPQNGTVKRTGLFSFLHKEYSFVNYAGIQTIRHTVNLIYVRTSVNLIFVLPEKNNKEVPLTVASLFREKSIDRFIKEFYSIMNTTANNNITQ